MAAQLQRGHRVLVDEDRRDMMDQWLLAWDMRTQLHCLQTAAPYWRHMREEYGEWSVPSEDDEPGEVDTISSVIART